jgi:hypothetical protein
MGADHDRLDAPKSVSPVPIPVLSKCNKVRRQRACNPPIRSHRWRGRVARAEWSGGALPPVFAFTVAGDPVKLGPVKPLAAAN